MVATLIIDSNATSRESLKRVLSARYPHIRLEEAVNGIQALQELEEAMPDVVLMNIRLPDLNGIEVLRRIRNSSGKVIIVVFADHDTPEYRDVVLSQGADYYISMWSSSGEEINSLMEKVFLWARAMAD